MTSTLQDAIDAVREGNYEEAQRQLALVVEADPNEARAWYLLSQIVDSDARRAAYLSKTLSLNPYHERAWAEFYSLPTEVVSRLEQGPTPAGSPTAAVMAIPVATAVKSAALSVVPETALPDWLRPVAKDQPVVAQRRSAPVPAVATQPAPQAATSSESSQGNRTLSILLAILLIATLLVLAFLVYLLLQN